MVVKLNYNFIAVLLSIVFVLSLCLLDVTVFAPADAKATVKQEQVKLPVAMYHHLLKDSSKWGDFVISPAQFEEDLQMIQKQGYETVSAKQIIDYTQKGTPLPEKPILITFDDGYEGVYEYAFPLLKQYKMKAVMSIIGKHTDIFSKPGEQQSVNYGHITWEQLREMQQTGVFEIGNHTYDLHGSPDTVRYGIKKKPGESFADYEALIKKDVGGLYDQIDKEIGVAPTVFAYPFGAICKESKPLLRDIGFSIVLTCEEKVNKLTSNMDSPVYLKRFNRAHSYSTHSYFKRLHVID